MHNIIEFGFSNGVKSKAIDKSKFLLIQSHNMRLLTGPNLHI